MDNLVNLIHNNWIVVLSVVIIGALSGVISIFRDWTWFYNTVLSKSVPVPVWVFLGALIVSGLWAVISADRTETTDAKDSSEWELVSRESFGVERVYLDGKDFINCRFDGTELVFKGESGFNLSHNTWTRTEPRIKFEGPAELTLHVMTAMYQDSLLRPIIEGTISNIKNDEIVWPTSPESEEGI